MSTTAMVNLWGRTIGAVSLDDHATVVTFEYEPAFTGSGIELAPLMMPLSSRLYSFPALNPETFHGLPGLLADSLPDRFGSALIDAWLARSGRMPESFNAVERLCYTGSRGMGALEYAPATRLGVSGSSPVDVDRLVALASEVLTHRNDLKSWFHDQGREKALKDILRIGTSAGGARAKAVIAWNPETNEVRSGQVTAGKGFEYWLMKFDGVSGNRDKELEDPRGYGAIEHAYYRMAVDTGITMNPCRMFEENGRRHFMTKRFDRLEGGGKLHMQSLCGMAHYDFNQAGAYGYEQALQVIRRLGLPMAAIEEQFRRMVFNIVARNQDDHVKNIAFLMDRSGNWSLSPAFDMTYSYQPGGKWTSSHQMTMNGKQNGFTLEDFRACAKSASMKRGRAETIIAEVRKVVARWRDYADESSVSPEQRDKIAPTLRVEGFK
ncbi:type II toxin-antitoxin system HipA family toxin [Chlorobium ferrooxidans]|uniref:HipA-like n=1 Tax=Chlorobium ferrooxidans DSM 13031 TaxID=377431 RepID=Q0YP84_9CHLB|nr:HipA-like [Chlorobium ferrooxidans DSM 13031]